MWSYAATSKIMLLLKNTVEYAIATVLGTQQWILHTGVRYTQGTRYYEHTRILVAVGDMSMLHGRYYNSHRLSDNTFYAIR